MSDLISRNEVINIIHKKIQDTSDFLQHDALIDVEFEVDELPTVEAIPKSYAEQICWERDVAVRQLNEIGCRFGQKMDEVKEKLETLQWILCNENLPEGCEDAELEVLVYTEEKYIEAEFKEVGFALYYPGEKKFRSVYNYHADITENVVAWMYKPKSYKGE